MSDTPSAREQQAEILKGFTKRSGVFFTLDELNALDAGAQALLQPDPSLAVISVADREQALKAAKKAGWWCPMIPKTPPPPKMPKKGACWCSAAWRRENPRNHQDRCVAEWNRRMRAFVAHKNQPSVNR